MSQQSVAKGKGKGSPPPAPKSIPKPVSTAAYSVPKVKVTNGELRSGGSTVVTSVDGTVWIERADGTVEKMQPTGHLQRLDFESIAALKELVQKHPQLLPCARSFSQGVPVEGLGKRLEDHFGAELKAEFIRAAGDNWSDADLDSDRPHHGRLGDASWPLPQIAVECDSLARPGYRGGLAHEYVDDEGVLREKVKLLADVIKKAGRTVVYAGAGLSTASGIADYATRTGSKGVLSGKSKGRGKQPITDVSSFHAAQPNFGHRTLAALADKGLIWRFIQQNHDGLPQKAGMSQSIMNEIHGAIFDPSNPVVSMSGSLRSDLFKDLLLCERKADLVLTLGSSLAGMNADRLAKTVSQRAMVSSPGIHGSVIVSLQTTPHDKDASIRIYATIDRTMELLADFLELDVAQDGTPMTHPPSIYRPLGADVDVFEVRYDDCGRKLTEDAPARRWDLRDRSTHTITDGPNKGARAIILGKTAEGHYRVGVRIHPNFQGDFEDIRIMGSWWVTSAVLGDVETIPMVNRAEE